jgi:hypothetical protein
MIRHPYGRHQENTTASRPAASRKASSAALIKLECESPLALCCINEQFIAIHLGGFDNRLRSLALVPVRKRNGSATSPHDFNEVVSTQQLHAISDDILL